MPPLELIEDEVELTTPLPPPKEDEPVFIGVGPPGHSWAPKVKDAIEKHAIESIDLIFILMIFNCELIDYKLKVL